MDLLPDGHPSPMYSKVSSPQNEHFATAGAMPRTGPAWHPSGPQQLPIVQSNNTCWHVDPPGGADCEGPKRNYAWMCGALSLNGHTDTKAGNDTMEQTVPRQNRGGDKR